MRNNGLFIVGKKISGGALKVYVGRNTSFKSAKDVSTVPHNSLVEKYLYTTLTTYKQAFEKVVQARNKISTELSNKLRTRIMTFESCQNCPTQELCYENTTQTLRESFQCDIDMLGDFYE